MPLSLRTSEGMRANMHATNHCEPLRINANCCEQSLHSSKYPWNFCEPLQSCSNNRPAVPATLSPLVRISGQYNVGPLRTIIIVAVDDTIDLVIMILAPRDLEEINESVIMISARRDLPSFSVQFSSAAKATTWKSISETRFASAGDQVSQIHLAQLYFHQSPEPDRPNPSRDPISIIPTAQT